MLPAPRAPRVRPGAGSAAPRAPGYLRNPAGPAPWQAGPPHRPQQCRAPAAIGAGGLTFPVTVRGRALVMAGLAVELALEAGGAGALGGQVILQAQDVILQAQDAQC